MKAFVLAMRQLRRDWRAGELTILVLALIIAVASVSSVNFFTSRIHQALESQANELLGGDLVLVSSNPIARTRLTEADELGLQRAETMEFPTMVLAGEQAQLASLKAVSASYPLRGHNRVATEQFAADREVEGGPARGSVWAAGRLLSALDIDVGDEIQVGSSSLTVTGMLTSEPDQAGGMLFGVAPRLLMHLDDLPATGLVQPASRIRYRLLIAGDSKVIEKAHKAWKSSLAPGERLNTIKDARPQIRTALERGESFLGLAALVSVSFLLPASCPQISVTYLSMPCSPHSCLSAAFGVADTTSMSALSDSFSRLS